MTIVRHELKRGRVSLAIWAGMVGAMIVLCMVMFPEMKDQMAPIEQIFSRMGAFSAAFGMDKLSFGTLMGFYGIECGAVLAIGGGFFAALLGVTALSKEESGHTAEFLLTHPISRLSIMGQKLLACLLQVLAFNVFVILCAVLSAVAVGESFDFGQLLLIHAAHLILQLELMLVCFGLSGIEKRAGLGLGIGIAALAYFLNIVINISSKMNFLQYLTPYAYAEASKIIAANALNGKLVLIGAVRGIVLCAAGCFYYLKKDVDA